MVSRQPIGQSKISYSPQSQSSYAKVAVKMNYPTKEQALIMDSIEGSSIEDYLLALAKRGKESDVKKRLKTSTDDPKTQDFEDIKEQLQAAANMLESDSSKGSLDIDSLANFISECESKSNLTDIALKYTTNLQEVTDELSAVEPLLTNKNIKNRITRIIKHFKEKFDRNSWCDVQPVNEDSK
ncbi:hypothetical protein QAD02_020491 [Eretmocerus hayati]|uniref:Uncharacterized protein n=1 Tax=Eretmocerus hayati TaxID=131215 RepID=A0ACC2PMM9_9HYME|nr:hypothetical protein QAD02_020491 [Eretmocerus hayati]